MTCGFVYNGQVYAGDQYGTNWIPCYWESAGQHDLPVEKFGGVESIFVNGNGVYAGGWCMGTTMAACYWDNNGMRRDGFSGAGSAVMQIVVDNNRVYMGGQNSSGACYWVDDGGTATEYPLDGVRAGSIFVRDNQVYAGGWYDDGGKEIACYWDGAGRHSLANPDSDYAYVRAIFVYNNRVYAAGSYEDAAGEYACYWDGAGKRNLDGGSYGSVANCILAR